MVRERVVVRRMRRDDGDDEGCRSNDNAIDGATGVDGFDNGAGVTINEDCVCACVIACQVK